MPGRQDINSASASFHKSRSSLMSRDTPIVFVVDDDISVRESLESLIRFAGWQPQIFASAEEFLSRPRLFVPSCLVLDVTLPDLNGLDLQKRIAADRIDMPIIFITGHGDVPMAVRAMKAGAVEFLTKPYDDEVLLSAIQQAIECSHAALRRDGGDALDSGPLRLACELGISEITVKAHRGSAMRKMNADSLADLLNIAARLHPTQAQEAAHRNPARESFVGAVH